MTYTTYSAHIHSVILLACVAGCLSSEISFIGSCPSIEEGIRPRNDYVQITLYTRENTIDGECLELETNNILNTKFNPDDPTKILIHGFTSYSNIEHWVYLRSEYFKRGNFNIISINWSYLAQGPIVCYPSATLNTNYVGKCVGKLIQQIRESGAMDIHVIGHSLGAQVANDVAKYVSPILPRITGLDPAGPLYSSSKKEESSLDPKDATFVDVIHTNAGLLGQLVQGGHADFYVNGGSIQPGCAILDVTCSHQRSVYLFAESINTDIGFYGIQCHYLFQIVFGLCFQFPPQPILMGEYANITTRGLVVVPTNGNPPFAMGP